MCRHVVSQAPVYPPTIGPSSAAPPAPGPIPPSYLASPNDMEDDEDPCPLAPDMPSLSVSHMRHDIRSDSRGPPASLPAPSSVPRTGQRPATRLYESVDPMYSAPALMTGWGAGAPFSLASSPVPTTHPTLNHRPLQRHNAMAGLPVGPMFTPPPAPGVRPRALNESRHVPHPRGPRGPPVLEASPRIRSRSLSVSPQPTTSDLVIDSDTDDDDSSPSLMLHMIGGATRSSLRSDVPPPRRRARVPSLDLLSPISRSRLRGLRLRDSPDFGPLLDTFSLRPVPLALDGGYDSLDRELEAYLYGDYTAGGVTHSSAGNSARGAKLLRAAIQAAEASRAAAIAQQTTVPSSSSIPIPSKDFECSICLEIPIEPALTPLCSE